MGLITSAGIGSGIDIESIIGAILDAERAPKEASLRRNEQRVDSTLSAIGQLSSGLSKLNDALDNLNSLSDFSIRTANVSDDGFISVITNSETANGSFDIDVNTLAQGSRLESTAGTFTDITNTVGQGNLTFTAGSNTFDIAIDSADSLETIRDNINASGDNFGVNANIINGTAGPVLVFTSTITGDTNTLVVSNDDASLDSISSNLTTTQSANSASVSIDGISITSNTNTFTDAIQDVTFTILKETDVGSPLNLSIDSDTDAVKTALRDFVDAVNDFQTISQRLGQSSEQAQGELAGDVTLRILSQNIVTSLSDPVTGLTGNINSLNSIGITFDQLGKLSLDEDQLDNAIASNFDAVARVFAEDSQGVSIRVQTLADNYIGSGGILDIREDSLNEQKRRLETDRLNFDFRITQLETQLRAKFGAMDALVAQFNSTSNFLSQQLATLPGANNSQS
jgi:flagellar hook-associated protein 2